jgi:formiminotetrahydrofolate cyclodeaminase
MESSYLNCEVGEFLDLVARRQPAPGGGAVAAIAMSLAAGLVAMVARYSRDLDDADRLVETADRLREDVATLADDDAHAYGRVIEAYAAARDNPGNQPDRISDALRGAAQVPLTVAEAGADICEVAARLAVEGKPDVRGDAMTALLLAEAATRTSAHLVTVNVEAAGDGEDLVERAVRSVAAAHAAVATAQPVA